MKKLIKLMGSRPFLIAEGILILLLISLISIKYNQMINEDNVIRIYLDGKIIKTIPLSSVNEDYTFSVTGKSGISNTIHIYSDGVSVDEATCPNQVCVHQGKITNSHFPITCLPNNLVITIEKADTKTDVLTR